MDLGFLITQSLYNQVMKKNSTVLIEISALLKRNVIPNKWSNRTDVKVNLRIDGGGKWKEAEIGRDMKMSCAVMKMSEEHKGQEEACSKHIKTECLSQELPW